MEFVIWGVTPLGKYLMNNMIHNHKSIKPFAYVDNNLRLQNTLVDGVPVISYRELVKNENLKEITVLLTIKNARNIFQVLEQLSSTSFCNVGIVKPGVLFSGLQIDPWKQNDGVIWSEFAREKYRVIPRIEVNLIDACNLKCKGCTHFSSLYKEDSIYPLENYEKDLIQLRNVGQILRLRLLGGEPFLLSNLDQYILIARKIFSEADIEVVTNGLLIPQTDERIMSVIKLNNIGITISPYQPTLNKKKHIAERLEKYEIPWHFDGEEILQFSRNLTLHDTHNGEISNAGCLSAACTFLRKGKLYKCPFEGLINDFYHYYGIKKEHASGLDIYQEEETIYEKLIEYALKPVEMCNYCAEKPEYIPWSVKANPSLEDWLYNEGM